MTHLSAHRNMVLSLVAVMAIAGCATSLRGNDTGAGSAAPVRVTAAGAAATASPDTSSVDQQVGSIDNQLNNIDSQLNAANGGLSSSEGDPAQ
ncbi:MAG: hypothetical protein WCB51_04970 [Candidatus Dormiibacterota bacterium]